MFCDNTKWRSFYNQCRVTRVSELRVLSKSWASNSLRFMKPIHAHRCREWLSGGPVTALELSAITGAVMYVWVAMMKDLSSNSEWTQTDRQVGKLIRVTEFSKMIIPFWVERLEVCQAYNNCRLWINYGWWLVVL